MAAALAEAEAAEREVRIEILPENFEGRAYDLVRKVTLAGGASVQAFEIPMPDAMAWAPDTPNLYRCRVTVGGTPVDATVTTVTLRSILSFEGPGRVRADLERNETRIEGAVERMPYELTDGRPAGRSWVLRVNADYRITSFLQATLTYLGRSEEHRPVVHNGRAEVKAFF